MIVAELIAELQRMPPGKPVKVLLTNVTHCDELGDFDITLTDEDAIEADHVFNMGSHVLIRSR